MGGLCLDEMKLRASMFVRDLNAQKFIDGMGLFKCTSKISYHPSVMHA